MQEVSYVYRSLFVHVTVASLSSVVSICLNLLLPSISKPFFTGNHVAPRVLAFRVRCVYFIIRDAGIPRCGLSVFASWIFVHETFL